MGALALTPQADARWSRPLPVLMRLVPRLARPSPQLAYLASAHLPRLLGRKRCGGLVDAAALRAAAAAATVAAARRSASHARAAAAAPLPPLRGDGQAHSSSAGQKGLVPLVVPGSGPCWLFSSRWLLAHPLGGVSMCVFVLCVMLRFCYVIFMSFCGASIPQMNIRAVHPEFYSWRLLWTERLMGCPIRLRERARRPFTHSIEDRCTLYQEPLLT